MSSSIDLGSISASVELSLEGLKKGAAEAKTVLSSVASDMGGSLDKVKDGSAKISTAVQADFDKMAAAAKAKTAEIKASMQQLGSVLTTVGSSVAVAGAAVTAALGGAAKTATEFEASLRNVDSIAKLTDTQFKELHDSTLALASDPKIRQGPNDLAKALYDIYSSGFTGAKALDILKQSAYGASAGLTTTATSSKVVTAVLNSGIGGVTSAKDAMDVLFREVDLGVNNFEELANTIGNVLPTAKIAGVSLQEVAAALAAMTRRGINVNESTTALNQLLNHIIKPGRDAKAIFDELGISYGISGLQAHGLTGILQQMSEKTDGNKQKLVELMPEVRGLKALLSLTDESGRQYNEMLDGMKKATDGAGAAQSALERQNKSGAAQLEILRKNFEILSIKIGEALLPILAQVTSAISSVVEWFSNMDAGTRDAIVRFTALVGVLAVVGGGALVLIGQLIPLFAAISAIGPALAVVGAALSEFAIPIALVVAGIALLAAAWATDWNGIREKTQEVIAYIVPYLKAAWAEIVKTFEKVGQSLRDFWKRIEPDVKQALATISSLLAHFGITWENQWNSFANSVRLVWDVIKGVILIAWNIVAGIIETGLKILSGDWRGAWDSMGNYLRNIWTSFADTVRNGVNDIRNLIQGVRSEAANISIHDNQGLVIASPIHDNRGLIIPDVAKPSIPHTGGGGGGGGGKGKKGKADKDAERDAKAAQEERERDYQEYLNRMFELSHTEEENEVRKARQTANALKIGTQERVKLLAEEIAAIRKKYAEQREEKRREIEKQKADEREQREDRLQARLDEIDQLTTADRFEQRRLQARADFRRTLNEYPGEYGSAAALYQAQLTKILQEEEQAQAKALNQTVQKFAEAWQKIYDIAAKKNEERRKEADKINKEEEKRLDDLLKYQYKSGQISLSQYLDNLRRRAKAYQENSDERIKADEEINKLEEKQASQAQKEEDDRNKARIEKLKPITDGLKNVFDKAFTDLFQNGFKNFFNNILGGFAQMIEGMLAQWAASKIVDLITSGIDGALGGSKGKGGDTSVSGEIGGLLGSIIPGGGIVGSILGGIGSLFGFDGAHNDRLARHFGFDFAHHFSAGMADFGAARFTPAAAGAGGGSQHLSVNIHIPQVHIDHPADVNRIADQIAYRTAERLRGTRFGSG